MGSEMELWKNPVWSPGSTTSSSENTGLLMEGEEVEGVGGLVDGIVGEVGDINVLGDVHLLAELREAP